jgi:hypothetical protein
VTKINDVATTGTISNARTSGTSSNTASTLVLRDSSGNFAAGTITANAITLSSTTRDVYISASGMPALNASGDTGVTASGSVSSHNVVFNSNSNATSDLQYSLVLPQGATITKLEALVIRNDNGSKVTVNLSREDFAVTANATSVVTIDSSTLTQSASFQTLSSSALSESVTGHVYLLKVSIIDDNSGGNTAAANSIASIHVQYTITSPLP